MEAEDKLVIYTRTSNTMAQYEFFEKLLQAGAEGYKLPAKDSPEFTMANAPTIRYGNGARVTVYKPKADSEVVLEEPVVALETSEKVEGDPIVLTEEEPQETETTESPKRTKQTRRTTSKPKE